MGRTASSCVKSLLIKHALIKNWISVPDRLGSGLRMNASSAVGQQGASGNGGTGDQRQQKRKGEAVLGGSERKEEPGVRR